MPGALSPMHFPLKDAAVGCDELANGRYSPQQNSQEKSSRQDKVC
jgi:hypothetical protein